MLELGSIHAVSQIYEAVHKPPTFFVSVLSAIEGLIASLWQDKCVRIPRIGSNLPIVSSHLQVEI